jgi:hypothetical protein
MSSTATIPKVADPVDIRRVGSGPSDDVSPKTSRSAAESPVEVVAPTTDAADRSFGRAVITGSLIGIVLFIAAVWIGVRAVAPAEWPAGAITAIAVWTGIWCGLFLGGTVAVGRWSLTQGH